MRGRFLATGWLLLISAHVLAQTGPTSLPTMTPRQPRQSLLEESIFKPKTEAIDPTSSTAKEQPAAPRPDLLLRFDPQRAEVRLMERRWCLVAGDTWLKDFGRDERLARAALNLVRALHLTEMAQIGQPEPVMEYFLSDGRAPHGFVGGLNLTTFNPQNLEIKQFFSTWRLMDKQRPILSFTQREQAERALAIIKHHQFNQLGQLGLPNPVMTVFLNSDGHKFQESSAPASKEGPKQKKPEPSPSKPARPAGINLEAVFARVPFDYRQAQLRKVDQSWKIMIGAYPLKDFGSNEQQAREVLRTIQYYQFTEQYALGEGERRFEFFLSRGQAPRGRMLGQDMTFFHTDYLTIRHIDDAWWINQLDQKLFQFDTQEQAQHALEAIKRYHFDHVCYLGRPNPSLMYFIRTK
jgi:hypothetical protein